MVHIIDDDQNVREGFMILLKSAGIMSTSYESAEQFLKTFNPGENDLVILDIHMPGIDGCTLLEYLNKKNPLPVIIITAYDEKSSRDCAKKYGALAYLRKPVDCEALIDIIKFNLNESIVKGKN